MPRTKEQFEEIRKKTRQQILDAGLKIFAHKGYHGASIADIAKEAGVSKGLAYNYFSSKKDLARSILLQINTMFENFDQLFNSNYDPYTILHVIVRETFKHIKINEKFWRMYMSVFTQIELAEMAKQTFGKSAATMLKELTKVFSQLEVSDPNNEARVFGATLDGIILGYLFDIDDYPLEDIETFLISKYSKENMSKWK